MCIQTEGDEIQENHLSKTQSNKQDLKPKMCCFALGFLEWVIPQTQDMDIHFLAPCCIMHCQEMSQPVHNNPYSLSVVPLLCSSPPYSPLPLFLSSVWSYPSHPPLFEDGVENNGTKWQEEHRWREWEEVRVSSYSEGIEHDVHFVLCGAALYAHRFSDDVGKESMGHSQYQECKSIGGKLQLDRIGK